MELLLKLLFSTLVPFGGALRWVWALILPVAGPIVERIAPGLARARELAAPVRNAASGALLAVAIAGVVLVMLWIGHALGSHDGRRDRDLAWQTRLFAERQAQLKANVALVARINKRTDVIRATYQSEIDMQGEANAKLEQALAVERDRVAALAGKSGPKIVTASVCYPAAVARALNK